MSHAVTTTEAPVEIEVETIGAGGHPDLPRRHLPIDDDVAAALAFDVEDAVGQIPVEICLAVFQLGLDVGEDDVDFLLEFGFVHAVFLCFRLYLPARLPHAGCIRALFMKSCWAQYLLWFVIATLGMGGALTACGQKGALYRPSEQVAPPVADAPELAAPAADTSDSSSTAKKP